MQKTLRLLAATLFFGTLFTACSDDDDHLHPHDDQELITTLIVTMTSTTDTADVVTAIFRDSDGPGGNAPSRHDTIRLKPNTLYKTTLVLLDESGDTTEDITAEVEQKGDEHEFFYVPSQGLNLTVTKTDRDKNNRPVGLKADAQSGDASTGSLRIVLKHQPGRKSANSNINTGDTDVEVDFTTVIQ